MPTKYVNFQIEVTARVDATMERNDYGVDGSPVWYEPNPDSLEVSGIEIEGVEISLASVGETLYDLVEDIAAETALMEGEWHD